MPLRGRWGDAPLPAGSRLLPPRRQPELQAAVPRETGPFHPHAFASDDFSLSDRDVGFQLEAVSPWICFECGRITFSYPSPSIIFLFPCVSK